MMGSLFKHLYHFGKKVYKIFVVFDFPGPG